MTEEVEFDNEDNSFKLCVLCASELKDKSPKLLSCLHTLCLSCFKTLVPVLNNDDQHASPKREGDAAVEKEKVDSTTNSETGDGGHEQQCSYRSVDPAVDQKPNCENAAKECEDSFSVSCPACNLAIDKTLVIDNLFVNLDADAPIVIDEDEEEKEEIHKCTACDEGEEASSFCLDCREWLCDQCVDAHKRVRVTKDHTISPKSELKKDDEPPVTKGQKSMFCRIHKHEPLKLFCETCDKLTCRDCQLLEHKDHRYQFMNEAISKQREILQHVVVKVKQKLQNYNQADRILQAKNQELKTKLVDVCDNIKNVTDTLVKEINSHSEKLVSHLEKYISSKTNVISDKQRLVNDAVFRMKHAVQFVETALTMGDDLSILYTKASMMKVLDQLSRTGIPFHPSILNYAITFEHEKDFLLKNIIKVGHLVIDGMNYPSTWQGGHVMASQPPATVALPVGPFQTTAMHSHPANAAVPPSLRPPIPGFESVSARVPPAIYNHIKQQVKNYPPEKQREMFMKMVEQYQVRQQQKAVQQFRQQQLQQQQQHQTPAGIYGGILTGSTYNQVPVPVVEQATRNLNNITNGGMQPRAPPVSSSASRFPASGAMQNLANIGPNYFNSVAPSRPALQGRILQQPPPPPPYNRPLVPQGAQAASHANKTPSPAGAGFDQSGSSAASHARVTPELPTTISSIADSGQAVGSNHGYVKQENEFPPCSFSQPQLTSVIPPPQPPPPLVHMKPPVMPVGGGKTMPVIHNNDPNEDYCAVCQNGGDLLCCDKCPKVFHLKCHVPELNTYPSGEWSCILCAKEDAVCLMRRENKEFTIIPGTGKRKAPTGLTDNEIKACERILLELYCHHKSTVFHEPVSKAVPNYYKIITNPIDFGKIKCKLQRQNFNHYNTVDEFIVDVNLVFRNCRTYNDTSSEIWKHGKMVEEELEHLVHRFLPCYVDVLDEERNRPLQSVSPHDPDRQQAKKKRSDDTAIHFF